MNSRIWLINVALLGIVSFFGIKTYGVWSHPGGIPEKKTTFKSAVRSAKTPIAATRKKMPPAGVYDIIVKKDLFDPERQHVVEEVSEKETDVKDVPTMSTNVFLYGVVLTQSSRQALMTDPDKKTRRKKVLWVREGDNLGDFRVSRIEREKVVLEKDGKTYDISLYDKKKPKSQLPVRAKRVEKPKVATVESVAPKIKPNVPKPSDTLRKGNKLTVKTPFGTIKREKK
jgi:type II secretory pathway component PulC